MNRNEVNINLEEFCRKYLSPSKEERDAISKRYKELQNILPGNEIFQSGSYARETSISPVHDLDIIWVLPESSQIKGRELFAKTEQKSPFYFDVKEPLENLAQILIDGYRRIKRKVDIDSSQTHSVNISFPDENFSIDVVPALKSGKKNVYGDDVYLVPEIQKLGRKGWSEKYKTYNGKVPWILSDPKGYINQSLELNSNPSYRKTIKFAKVWKKSCNAGLTNFELKSFHLELVIADIFSQNKNINFYDATSLFLGNVNTWIAGPAIPDMADNSILVDKYLNEDIEGTQRKLASKYANKSFEKLQNMLLMKNINEINSLLRESLIAPSPWPISQNARNIKITCQIERRDKVRNSSSWRSIKYNLRSYELQAINGPKLISSGEYIGKEYFLLFTPLVDGLDYDEIRWLVVNNGQPALDIARIGGWRGNEFHFCEGNSNFREERTEYPGMHWVDCYVIKNGTCIGTGRFFVGISMD